MKELDGLRVLIHSELINCGRCNSMDWLWFNQLGSIYAIHLQCPWRIVDQERVLLANEDMYYPNTEFSGDYDEFEWDNQGGNLFDEKVGQVLNTEKEKWTIKSYVTSPFGDLEIEFENGKKLQIFITGSTDSEQWRFFKKDRNEPHIVVKPNNYSLE